MIYFDNAATGGFKPRVVTDSATNIIRYLSANPGRSGHRLSVTGAKIVYDCRVSIAELFNANCDRVIFTKNCTEALNIAILGSIKKGGHVITTVFEHNSVLRPLNTLKEQGIISLDIVSPSQSKTIEEAIEDKINENTYMIVCSAVNNVTGLTLPIREIGSIAKKHGIYLLVDGAQAGGHISLDMKKDNISFLALAGHKGLYGIMGSGVLIINNKSDLEPVYCGGTGSESFNLFQPRCYPERLESGTLNLPAIASLNEGIKYIKNNFNTFSDILFENTTNIINKLNSLNIKCFSKPNPSGIVSFLLDDISSEDVADILNIDYDIAVRGGYHCAPLTHKYLHTDNYGLVRVSLSVQNSFREITTFLNAIKQIKRY